MYSLHSSGFHVWWTYAYDPYSLYADDGMLFIENRTQLPKIIRHIQKVGKYTGLVLNLKKTFVFDHRQVVPTHVAGVLIQSALVKYLGIFVGLGDLSKQNFETVLRKARKIINNWSKRKLSLPARVLVSKTFVFSMFVHMCNCAWITND